MNPESRVCQNCKQEFTIDSEDFAFYANMEVPPPTFCWLCRAQRRFAFRNERALYKRKSDLSGKDVFSTYQADAVFPVYAHEEWFSDGWDPLAYGQDYDFSRSFFEQFKELWDKVPRPSKSASGFQANSDYSNNATDLKNCYLVFNSEKDEDCAYGNALGHCNSCFDNSLMNHTELSYGNFNIARSSRVFFSVEIVDSADIYFSKNLRGCHDCFGCMNLRKKSYQIFNKQYSKEEYAQELKKFDMGSYAGLEKILPQTEVFWLRFPNKFRSDGSRNMNVSGEYVYQSKNAHKVYQALEAENVKYCQYINWPSIKDSYDFSVWGRQTERAYEAAMAGAEVYNIKFCLQTYTSVRDMEYCDYCTSSKNLFGCIGMRNNEYCILNKQYSKEEYEELVPRIKKQMQEMPYVDKAGREYRYGEFFPPEFSPFGYNETIAQEHFPLSREEISTQKYNWKDVESKHHTVTKSHAELADHIKDVDESTLKETIGCAHEGTCSHGCAGAFRIILPELEFCKRFGIALPRLCATCRHRERLAKRNSMRLWPRQCMCDHKVYANAAPHGHHPEGRCPNEFETAYGPERPEIIYCEACYQIEVT